MARRPRLTYPGAIFHVLNRFVDRHPFFRGKSDYEEFMRIYRETAKTCGILTYSYCLMPNHFHFCIQTTDGEISSFLRRFLTRAAQTLNRAHLRTGHLLQGRTKTLIVESEAYFETVNGYILLNAVRAGLVKNVLNYPWSSARELVDERPEPIVARHALAEMIAGRPIKPSNVALQERALRNWLASLDPQSNEDDFRGGHHGSFLSSAAFRRSVLDRLERRKSIDEARRRRKTDRPAQSLADYREIARDFVRAGDPSWFRAWASGQAAEHELTVWLAHEAGRWTYERIQAEDKDRRPLGSYSMAVSRIRKDITKRKVAQEILDRVSSDN
jgi:REP element-mobilizing transposase RayT